LLLSVLKFTHAPLHGVSIDWVHVMPHVDPEQVGTAFAGAVHPVPQLPQLAGSLVVSTHAPEQFVNPLLHE
jgi:hypothetical protein